MVIRLFALLALLVLLFWSFNAIARRYSLSRKQARLLIALGAILTTIVVLVVMGRIHPSFILAPLGVAATFLLRLIPHLFRLLPIWQMLKSKGVFGSRGTSNRDGNKSVIRTEFLSVELRHGTGDMDGEIIKGSFEGRQLSSLSLDQLMELASECRQDSDSIQVLEAYLDRMHDGWRDQAQAEEETQSTSEEPAMNRELALEILGLGEDAAPKDVTRAHRSLMQKLHPDRGGTEYLAKKINAARDFLLERL